MKCWARKGRSWGRSRKEGRRRAREAKRLNKIQAEGFLVNQSIDIAPSTRHDPGVLRSGGLGKRAANFFWLASPRFPISSRYRVPPEAFSQDPPAPNSPSRNSPPAVVDAMEHMEGGFRPAGALVERAGERFFPRSLLSLQ